MARIQTTKKWNVSYRVSTTYERISECKGNQRDTNALAHKRNASVSLYLVNRFYYCKRKIISEQTTLAVSTVSAKICDGIKNIYNDSKEGGKEANL